MESTNPVFTTCGVQIPLSNNEPESINILHAVPKGYAELTTQRAAGSKCDVTLKIGEKEMRVHRAVLSERIPFFRALFNSNMVESLNGEVDLSAEFDSKIIESLLNYAYTGRLTISCSDVQSLMMGAVYFNMDLVIDECARFMRRRLMVENALAILSFCRSIAYQKINDFINRFIDKNFVHISLTPEFLELSFDELDSIFRRESFNVDNEKQVFYAISRWIKHNEDRKVQAARLLKYVRCSRLRETFITDVMEKRTWLAEDSECMSLISEAKECIRDRKKRSQSFKSTERVSDEAHRLIVTIGFSHTSTSSTLKLYDPISNNWQTCTVPTLLAGNGVVSMDNKIFIIDSAEPGQQFFNITTNTWDKMPKLPQTKHHFAFGVIDGQIYVAGGYRDSAYLASMERYNPKLKEWSSLPAMPAPRCSASACELNGRLYVIGGSNAPASALDTFEYYCPVTESWTAIRKLHHARKMAGVAVLNGQIYVAGGFSKSSSMCSMERYDPCTDTWTILKSMKISRYSVDLVVSCGKLFAIGGYASSAKVNGKYQIVETIEMYDPETDSWEDRSTLTEEADYIYATSIRIPSAFPSPVSNLESEFDPSHSNGFDSFYLKDELFRGLTECGIEHPSKTQHGILPQALNGMDVNCQAKSGVGKTTLYAIATLQHLEPIDGVSTLVLCHSRELASDISNIYTKLSKYLPGTKVAVFSGEARTKKNRGALLNNSPHIILGTPGRILALVQSGALKLDKIKHIVIDECDRLFENHDMQVAIQRIFKFTPEKKQVMMFSECLPKDTVCSKFIKNIGIEVEGDQTQRVQRKRSIKGKKDK